MNWRSVGVLAAGLFAVNVAARLVARFGFDDAAEIQDRLSLGMFAVVGLILAIVAFVRGRRQPVPRWASEVAVGVLGATLLTILVGPFISGSQPFAAAPGDPPGRGIENFFYQILQYVGFAGGGVLVGYLVLTALGLDYRSQSLKRYADNARSKPRRVVRR